MGATSGYLRVLKGTSGYLRVLKGTSGYLRVLKGTRRNVLTHYSFLLCLICVTYVCVYNIIGVI